MAIEGKQKDTYFGFVQWETDANHFLQFWLILISMGILSFLGCKSSQDNKNKAAKVQADNLAGQLSGLGYEGLFMHSGQEALEALWQVHKAAGFAAVVRDASASNYSRLLANEVLEQKGQASTLPLVDMANIYCQSLAVDFTLLANPWGTPEHLGGLSQRVVHLGEDALPALRALLGQEDTLQYIGSRDATTGSMLQIRVKDFAAAMIAAVTSLPYEMGKTHDERDAWITKMIMNQ